jgi:beta-galactosidase
MIWKSPMKISLVAITLAILFGIAPTMQSQRIAAPFQIDATKPAPSPETGFLHLGGVSPAGQKLEVNSRYLSLDGKPWLPVSGEFHFARFPEKYWQEELQKMKAGGVQVVASYIFWIHHEEIEGQFDWTGQRDLHHFIELCAKNGLYVYLRIGPWDHGETRNGGLPNWLVEKKIPLRRNDPEYLKYVSRFYRQIGGQIKGQQWQEGGPILGVQLENEYGETGPGAGGEHIAELRRLAIAAGINPPLFSITGWPNNSFPAHEFIPFFGVYPDDFWSGRTTDVEPDQAYLFASDHAVGDLGAMTAGDATKKMDLRHYPFFTAEQGGGMETSYQRRPLMQPDDIAALTLIGLGSGANLYGYYMFHGGANPVGKLTTLQESLATGYPNDLPVVSYDFQAPLGKYGQERESFRKLKSLHLFLQSLGPNLAVMAPYAPAQRPKDAADLSTARVMLRADGNSGFLFVNNFVRKHNMAERRGFQVRVKLPTGPIALPRTPIDVPANSYFIWPMNLDLGAGALQYSTAQLLSRMDNNSESTWFFFAIPGIRTEFSFDARSVASVRATSGTVTRSNGSILVQGAQPGKETVLQMAGKNGHNARIVLLTEAQAEQFWRVPLGGVDTAILTQADVFADGEVVHLRSVEPSRIAASLFMPGGKGHAQRLWQERSWKIEPRKIDFVWSNSREAATRAPIHMANNIKGRDHPMPQAPEDAEFAGAAAWTLSVPAQSMTGLSDVFLRIRYAGDVARLYRDGRLLDDDFYNGRTWEIGLKRFLPEAFGQKFEVDVLPLMRNSSIYLDARAWEAIDFKGQTGAPSDRSSSLGWQSAKVLGVEALPEYEVLLRPAEHR